MLSSDPSRNHLEEAACGMPTYEYECNTCGTTFDLFQSITADPLKRHRCEKCKRVRPVRRLLGAGGALIFKGSGFYATDYRGESYKKAAAAESGSAKPAKDSASDKPAAMTESAASSPKSESPKPKKSGSADKS